MDGHCGLLHIFRGWLRLNPFLHVDRVSLAATVGQGWILQDLSFQLAPGQFVGLVGPSGAGKSSLLRLLNHLQSPSAGTVYWQGRSLSTLPPTSLRRQIGLVGQETHLLGMTVEQALHYPLRLQKIPDSERQHRVDRWMRRLHLPQDWLHKTELELSRGQQQQVAIARSLVMEPTLLLLDEPTSALDWGTATHLLSVLREEVQQTGRSVLMANHQLNLVEKMCDRVLYLEKGKLISDQPVTEVDWAALRQALLAASVQDAEEWD